MKGLWAWLDDRTGVATLTRKALFEPIPGGARWRYVWGSTLTFALIVQLVTGLVLWAAYSANAQGAWESVYFIQYQMAGGWILRGIHHYMAQATMVLLILHLMQVVIDGAYRAPREVNFWFGIGLLLLVMGLSLTGYLLPWDQTVYWSTKVATSIAASSPVIGPALQNVLIGGGEYGHQTLTRFFALHAGALPLAVATLIIGHVYLFRRHGITVRKPIRKPDGMFWPDQLLRDSIACLAVMATVLFLVVRSGGAELGAPANPTEAFAAARPEWYFLFLFQWLKYFPAGWETLGAIIIPTAVLITVTAMPFIARLRGGHRINLAFGGGLLTGIALLTALALRSDRGDPTFRAAQEEAEYLANRATELAASPVGIPVDGALAMVRRDALTQGPILFAANCAGCHRWDGHDGLGTIPEDAPSAADLYHFGSREWLTGLFDPERVSSDQYFGGTAHADGWMVRTVQRRIAALDASQQDSLQRVVWALSAEADLPYQVEQDASDAAAIAEGRAALTSETMGCTGCHELDGFVEIQRGPVLTDYASREWMVGMVHDPAHPNYYGENNDRMPRFGADATLSEAQIGLIVDWIRQDWYRVEDPSPEEPF